MLSSENAGSTKPPCSGISKQQRNSRLTPEYQAFAEKLKDAHASWRTLRNLP